MFMSLSKRICKIEFYFSQNISHQNVKTMNIDINTNIDDNGYGYYCDPSAIEYEHSRPRYYTFYNPDNTIHEHDEYYAYINNPERNYYTNAGNEKINMYTNLFIYGCITMITITITSTLIHYDIL